MDLSAERGGCGVDETADNMDKGTQSRDEELSPLEPTAMDSDKEYDDLCDALQRREAADRRNPDEEDVETESNDEELSNADHHQQEIDNIHCELVTPELSAEERECVPSPPKLSHKTSKSKKKSPVADRQKKSSRKLDYLSPDQEVPLHKAIKRKLLPKSDPKPKKKPKKCVSKKKQLQERTVQQDGTWVQCMRSECQKWRYLREITDPSLIPDYWACEQNTDPEHNSCEHSEEDYRSLEFVFTKFAEGSIVWAKIQGYPWWPAMIEEDPDTETYLEQETADSYPTHYHVVFLDKTVSRTWLKSTSIRKFDGDEDKQTQRKGREFRQQISPALERAKRALAMNVQDRIRTFGFSHTFKGKILDDSPCATQDEENASPDSKDEEEEEVDVEALDLEAFGLDVDEILEQAESLLSEAGETMLSLQGTSQTQVSQKKPKRGRKRKEPSSEENVQGKNDLKRKKMSKCNQKSDRAAVDCCTEGKKHKSGHHHRHHHHHSKKGSKVEDDGGVAESKYDSVRSDDQAEDKTVKDIKQAAPKVHKKTSKSKKSTMVQDDGSENLECSQRSFNRNKDDAQIIAADDKALQRGESDKDFEPQTKKAKSKSHRDNITGGECSTKRVKRPNSKKTPLFRRDEVQAAPTSKESDADGNLQKVRKPKVKKPNEGKNEQKVKKPRVKKAPASNLKTNDLSKTMADDPEASDAPQNQRQVGKSKKKRKEKDEAILKKKPSFKPPSKMMGVSSNEKNQASPVAPSAVMTSDVSSEKENQELIPRDGVTENSTSQSVADAATKSDERKSSNQKKVSSHRGTPPKPQKQKKDDSKTKGKAKFSIKKAVPLMSNSSESSTSKEMSMSKAREGPSSAADRSETTVLTTSCDESKTQKPKEMGVKRAAAPKKFSIKRKPTVPGKVSNASDESSHSGLTSTDPPELSEANAAKSSSDIAGSNIETPCTKKPNKSPQSSATKKFSIKPKPACSSESGTSLNLKAEDSTPQSQSKNVTSGPEENVHLLQNPGHAADDSDLFLDLEAVPLVDDATMEVIGGGWGMDDEAEESDDFSMEDLEDWPKDLEKPKLESPANEPQKLAAASGTDSQPFEIVEE